MPDRVARCSLCGRFVAKVIADGLVEGIVTGICTVHGEVEAELEDGWAWEDFFQEVEE